jgi:erythronate-4-phosphate dehydrogenase
MLKLIVDENIAFAKNVFNQFGSVTLLPGRAITNNTLKDTDILIVRSITNVDEKLLKETPVKFVGTATIGTDHIELDYLKNNNISFADAKGCNAYSVAEYILAALLNLAVKSDFVLKEKSIGIVGVGNVGSKVASFAQALGMKVLLNDPPLKRNGDKKNFVELDEILKCDIITLHVPLNKEGIDKTYHLFDKKILNKINDGTILINSARGAVIDNKDLLDIISKKNFKVVLDVWENEPDINLELLKKVHVGTSHIAGYSYEGKVNGTKIIYNSLCDFLGDKKSFSFELEIPQKSLRDFKESENVKVGLEKLISGIYSIKEDDLRMREMLTMNKEERIKYFDMQRKNYPKRREFNNFKIQSNNLSILLKDILQNLRFNVSNFT